MKIILFIFYTKIENFNKTNLLLILFLNKNQYMWPFFQGIFKVIKNSIIKCEETKKKLFFFFMSGK